MDSNAAQLLAGGPREKLLDPNQSPGAARGPPPPASTTESTDPSQADPNAVNPLSPRRALPAGQSATAPDTDPLEGSAGLSKVPAQPDPVPGGHAGAAGEPQAPSSQQLAGPHRPSEQMQLGQGQSGPNPAMFRSVTGHDPVTPQDWRTAATLDPSFGEPGVQPIIGAAKIAPKPGDGQMYGDAFIQDRDVLGLPPHMEHLGDNRGFDPSVGPEKSRVSFMVDYDNGLAIVRQNPTHATDGAADVHPAQVGIEQDPGGRVRMRLQATNGLLPEALGDLGESVRGDFIIDPHGGPHGVPSVNGKVTQYPSWEAYSSQVGQPPTTVLQRQQNPGGDLGPAMNLPRPSVDVGQRPQVLDQWRQQYHPDQASQAALRGYIDNHVIDPVHQVHDPAFYDYPMPDLPGSTPDGDGGIIIPPAGQVR